MKALHVMLLVCMFPVLLIASMVRNDPFEHIQPDGTKLNLFVTGNEFTHRVHDANGYTVVLSPTTGFAVYALPDGNGIKASEFKVGSIDPTALGVRPNLTEDPAVIEEKYRIAKENGYHRDSRNNTTGQWNNLVVFIRFLDQAEYDHTRSRTTYNTFFNGTGTDVSVKGYFAEESDNQLTVDSYMYPTSANEWIVSWQDSHNRNYYLPYNATTNPSGYSGGAQQWSRLNAMLASAINYLETNNQVPDALDLDADNDGNVDNVSFIIQGVRGNWGDCLWDWTSGLGAGVASLNGEWVRTYNTTFNSVVWVGRQCHEMSHSIGFPDLYHYTDNGVSPAAWWDLMDSDNQPPEHTLVYMKYKYGHWCSLPSTISGIGNYSLYPVSTSPFAAYKIASSNPNQFYMVEYRRKTGTYETSLQGSGLIAYRINTSCGDGNDDGPPDEVYVYRPNGNNSTQGNPELAFMSLESGRTGIHQYTNPSPFLADNTQGGLIISNVGSASSTISFRLGDMPNIWDGSSSTNWGTAANWSLNSVPTISQNVEIPAGMPRYPVVSSTANANGLIIRSGASLTVAGASMIVYQDLENYGTLTLNNASSFLEVFQDLLVNSGASVNVTNSGAYIYVQSDVEFREGSNVNLTQGTLAFAGPGSSFIRTYTETTINDLLIDKDSGNFTVFSNLSTATLTINGSIDVYSGSTLSHTYTGYLLLKGYLTVESGGYCTFNTGTLTLGGTGYSGISFAGTGSYVNNLTVYKTSGGSVGLSSYMNVYGNFYLQSGSFYCNSYTLGVKGNWTNSVGVAAFYEGTGTVELNGTSTQTMTTEWFNNLVLNKAGGNMSIPTGVTVNCNSYDWTAGAYTVSGGSFIVGDLVDSGILGTITLSSGLIDYTQGSQDIDLRAVLTISGGTFNVSGGNGPAYFGYIDPATLNMSNGILDFKDVGIYLPSSQTFTENITGGRLRTVVGFMNLRSDYTPTGGILELYGTADASLQNTAGSNLFNVEINKGSTRNSGTDQEPLFFTNRQNEREEITRNNSVIGSGPLVFAGYFSIISGSFSAPATIQVAGNWMNYAGATAFNEGTGSVEFNGSGHQYCSYSENFNTLLINKSAGAFRVNGYADVTCNSYTWAAGAVDVLSGTFTANDLTQNGIYGNFYNNTGGVINLYQDAGSWPDLNANIYNYGGTYNLYGGNLDCYWAYSANAGITMTSGIIDFKSRGMYINASAYSLTMNITGGTIRTVGSLNCNRTNVYFAAGTMEMYGSGNVAVLLGSGSYLNNLTINKTATRDRQSVNNTPLSRIQNRDGSFSIQDERFEGAYASSNLSIHGILNVNQGIFDVNGQTVETYDDIQVHGTIKMTTYGYLNCGDDFIWYSGSSSNINNGSISCHWDWRFDNGSTVQLTGCSTTMTADYDANITLASANSWFGSLILNGNGGGEGSTFDIAAASTQPLIVHGLLTVFADNVLDMTQHDGTIDNTVTIYANGGIVVGDGATLTMNGAFSNAGTLETGPGSVIVHGVYTSYDTASLLIVYGSFVNDIAWARSADSLSNSTINDPDRSIVEFKGAIHLQGGLLEVTNNSVIMRAHADRIFTDSIVRVGAGFAATETNAFHQDSGTLELVGVDNPTLNITSGNYLCNLTILKGTVDRVYLQQNITLLGNLTIASGGIITNSYSITVGGNWTNSVGTVAFSPGAGTVIFNKSGGTQTVSGATNFYNVTDYHTGTILDFQSTTGISNILYLTNGASFLAAATIGTLTNTIAASELKFTNAFTSTIAYYSGGGQIKAISGANVIINDILDNGLFGTFYTNNAVLEIHQDTSHYIDLNGPISIVNDGRIDIYGGSVDCSFAYAGNCTITMNGGELNFKNKGVYNYLMGYTLTTSITGGVITVAGGFYNPLTTFTPSGGRVELLGSTDGSIYMGTGSYFYDLTINKTSLARAADSTEQDFAITREGTQHPITRTNSIMISSALEIRRHLEITAGTVTANNNITVYGYWTNYAGISNFEENTYTVTFAGSSTETGVTTNETFYNLVINNSSTNYNNFKILASNTIGVTNDLTVMDGTINMQLNSVLNVGNDLTMASGAGINCNGASGQSISVTRHWNDNNTSYSNSAGYYFGTSTLSFVGSPISIIATSTTNFEAYHLNINKPGSEIRYNKPVHVYGNCALTNGLWTDLSNGMVNTFNGDLTIGTNGTFYGANQNTLAFAGGVSQLFTNNGSGAIYALTVNKTAGTTLSLGSTILGLNGGNIAINSGILDLNHNLYRTTGNLDVNNTGKISIDTDAQLELANNKTLSVFSGGVLELLGSSGHLAKLTHQSGYFVVNIESGGTISADYALFEYISIYGVNVKTGALVDASHSFNNCTFQYSPATGTLLTINNNQTLTINAANFPANIWSGSYNVSKTLNQGTVNFTSPTGTFSGEDYDNDTYNRITWPVAAMPDLSITAFYTTPSNPHYVCDAVSVTVTVLNSGAVAISTPFRLDLYYNRATPPPAGTLGDKYYTFSSLAAGASASYTFTSVSSANAVTWSSYVQVDASQVITESNEGNNVPSSISMVWQALPAINNLAITHPSTNQINLGWSYPIAVSRFKIYRDTNPYGSFSTLIGTPTGNVYPITVQPADHRFFYKVVAERDLP